MTNLPRLRTALIAAAAFAMPVSALAQAPNTPQQIGPDPTRMALEADRGPFDVLEMRFDAAQTPGFRGGTVRAPMNTDEGPFGIIAIVTGFVSPETSNNWWGARMASHGFVTITITTNSTSDGPPQRANQLRAALDFLIAQGNTPGSPIEGLVDEERQGLVGWSFGGGGAIIQSNRDQNIDAILPHAAFLFDTQGAGAPAFILACGNDRVAVTRQHSNLFYNMTQDQPKLYIEIAGGSHSCANSGAINPDKDIQGKVGVAFMKRFLDGDTRYNTFLCGEEHQAELNNPRISEVRDDACNLF